jgi:hypothetical protein
MDGISNDDTEDADDDDKENDDPMMCVFSWVVDHLQLLTNRRSSAKKTCIISTLVPLSFYSSMVKL